MTEYEIMSKNELIQELDNMNKWKFEFVGVMHIRSGSRRIVEIHKDFIESLNAKPHREIKIREPLTPQQRELLKHTVVLEFGSVYVNVYAVDDVKDKLKGISKYKCVVILGE